MKNARNYWTFEKIQEEALKYTTRSEFYEKSSGAYRGAKRLNILEKVCLHMLILSKKWTKEELQIESSKYKTRNEFNKKSNKCYEYARKLGILDQICKHMPKDAKIGHHPKKWTFEKIQEEALKYLFKCDFRKNSVGAYDAAHNLKIMHIVCSHMPSDLRIGKHAKNYIWTNEKLEQEALKYTTKNEFQRKSGGAYVIACRKGIIDNICKHMPKSYNSSNNEINLFNIIKELYPSAQKIRDRKANIPGKPHIKGFDIDIFIPELNLGIEFDGIYWHSFEVMRANKTRQSWPDEDIRNYHQIKDDYFASKGIKLLHITDLEWLENKEQSLSKVFEFLRN